jgi:multidrug resistance protein
MATVFVDMIGFFVVLPLLPFYAEKLGADPLRVGALISTFALAQLVTAPLWGRLSDHYGRRPMILLGLLISAGAYAIFELATAVWLLFLSRFVQGAGSGTTGVVLAYVSDSVGKEERAKALGWLTAATSAGVMLGPAIGSLSASLGWIGPGYLAAGLCLLNFAFGWRWLPEPANGGEGGSRQKPAERGATRRTIAEFLVRPRGPVASLVWIYTLGMMAFMAMNGVFALYLERVFGVTEATIGWFFVYVGGVSLIMRSLILGRVLARFGEVRVLRFGAVCITVGLATVPFAQGLLQLALAVLLIPVGTALLFPATTSMTSHRAAVSETGLVLGVQQAFGGVARMIGPIWAGAAFQHIGIRTPFWLAAGVMVLARLFAGKIGEEPPAAMPGEEEPPLTPPGA